MRYNSAAVTGSSGFIGTHLMRALESRGIDCLGVSRSTNSIDITKWELVEEIPAQDVLFHLAGITNIPKSFANPTEVYFTNYVGTLNALEWSRINDVQKMIYVSTFVYGVPQYLPVDENHPTAPNSPYSQSKLLGEELCAAYCRDYGLDVVILRLFNIYGPGQKGDFLIPEIMRQLSRGVGGAVVIRDPHPRRDFLYVGDAVDALIAASASGECGCNIFNIGSGKSYSAGEIAEMLADLYCHYTGDRASVKYTYAKRKSEVSETIANINKAEEVLKWFPHIDIKMGLSYTLRAYLDDYQE